MPHPEKAFKEEAEQLAARRGEGRAILSGGGALRILGACSAGGAIWTSPRRRPRLSRKRFRSVGAPGSGALHCRFYDAVNAGNFIDSPISAYLECGNFAVLLDNVAYRKPRKPGEFPKEINGGIKVYFPAYAPDPNPAEAEWK